MSGARTARRQALSSAGAALAAVSLGTPARRRPGTLRRYPRSEARPWTLTTDRTCQRELLAECGEGVQIRPPFHLEYGSRVSIGAGTFFNYDCLMLDVAPVTVAAACQVASRVQFITATHPIDPEPRRIGWESARPIVVGDNVWLSAGVIVCPGVTIGDDTVVGAGAVVTRDLPGGVVAMGVPARVIREIGEHDRIEIPRVARDSGFAD
jgi:maltose O-acetyltransferase